MLTGIKNLGLLVLIASTLGSCDNGEKTSLVTGTSPAGIAAPAPAATAPAVIEPASGNPTAIPVASPSASSATLNPAHGKPGHRCDIPVGSPLTQAAPTVSAPPVASPQTLTLPAVSTSSNARLNPKHGEPGHRCDIAVGAPSAISQRCPGSPCFGFKARAAPEFDLVELSVTVGKSGFATEGAACCSLLPDLFSQETKKIKTKHAAIIFFIGCVFYVKGYKITINAVNFFCWYGWYKKTT